MSTAIRNPRPGRAAGALGGLTVVLVCNHDAATLADVVAGATGAAERCAAEHEIVIVAADGGADDSVGVAGALASRDRRIRLLVHAEPVAYGEAMRAGIGAARMPWVLLTDAGAQLDFADLEDFVALAGRAELVMGWRVLPHDPIGERARAAVWNRFTRAAFGLTVRDVDCPFRLARRDVLERLDLRATAALAGAELLVKARAAGARIAQAPVHDRPRAGGGHRRPGRRVSRRTLVELVALRRGLVDDASAEDT